MTEPSAMQEVLDFMNSIGGDGYGGMASYEIARANVADQIKAIDRIASMWDYRLRVHVRKDYPLLAEAIDKLVGKFANE